MGYIPDQLLAVCILLSLFFLLIVSLYDLAINMHQCRSENNNLQSAYINEEEKRGLADKNNMA